VRNCFLFIHPTRGTQDESLDPSTMYRARKHGTATEKKGRARATPPSFARPHEEGENPTLPALLYERNEGSMRGVSRNLHSSHDLQEGKEGKADPLCRRVPSRPATLT